MIVTVTKRSEYFSYRADKYLATVRDYVRSTLEPRHTMDLITMAMNDD